MLKIPIKHRLVAIGTTIAASLLATAGLFFAISNLTASLTSFENITTDDTVLKIELFSPLLASIKNNKPTTDLESINSTLQQSLNLLANNHYQPDSIKYLLGSQGHSLINFTATGDVYLVTNKHNRFSKETLTQPLFSNSKTIDNLIIFSNNQDLINNINKNDALSNTILISFNDVAKVTVLNKLFRTDNLTNELDDLKKLLLPLSNESATFSANIQQSNHRTKIQFNNSNSAANSQTSPLSSLLGFLPRNLTYGFLSNNASTTINNLAGIANSDLLSKYITEEQPFLYAKDNKGNWLIATVSKDAKQIESLTSLFANLFETKIAESSLPDKTYAREIKIKDVKTLPWQNSSNKSLAWQIRSNKLNDLVIASNQEIYIAGNNKLINEIINKGGYYPEDCEINEISSAIVQKIGSRIMFFNENPNKNAIFCIFN